MNKSKGLVTIPTDVDVVSGTLELMERWGADALRDCDGTDFPQELRDVDAKIYSTYYTTRKDNDWARQNPDEIQQMYLMTPFYTASGTSLSIHLMKGLYPDMLTPNTRDDIKRWWEVVDRTTGKVVSPTHWSYSEETGDVTIETVPFHEYTVSFLAYIMWDPVHMYNAVTNSWKGVEHQITFDVRQPKTHAFTMKRLRKFIEEHPYVNVLRFTTFFHQFTLVFDELAREKYVDWYGYSASVSPYILQQFEEEAGYPFRPEYIIDQGYYNNQYRIPSKEYQDFQAFQRREVAKIVREMVDITHEYGNYLLFYRNHIIVNRLSSIIDLNIIIRIQLFQTGGNFLCVCFCYFGTVINTDQFTVFISHLAGHLHSNILYILSYCQDSLIADPHDISFMDILVIDPGIPYCISHLSGFYIFNSFHHLGSIFFYRLFRYIGDHS